METAYFASLGSKDQVLHNHFVSIILYFGWIGGATFIGLCLVVPLWRIVPSMHLEPNALFVGLSAIGALSSLTFYEGYYSPWLIVLIAMLWYAWVRFGSRGDNRSIVSMTGGLIRRRSAWGSSRRMAGGQVYADRLRARSTAVSRYCSPEVRVSIHAAANAAGSVSPACFVLGIYRSGTHCCAGLATASRYSCAAGVGLSQVFEGFLSEPARSGLLDMGFDRRHISAKNQPSLPNTCLVTTQSRRASLAGSTNHHRTSII